MRARRGCSRRRSLSPRYIVARPIAARRSPSLSQQVIADNRAGAAPLIGAELAARAAPDGYTWLLGTATTHAINASLVRKLPRRSSQGFAPVSLVAILPQVFVAHPPRPAHA